MSESKTGAASIKVIGIGRAGCNTITRMVREGVRGLEYIAMDTDADYLEITEAPVRICLGEKITAGLGAGGDPDNGRGAAEESRDEVKQAIAGADMVFLVAGLGGGTGSGAIPVIAELAKQSDVLTVAVVAKPFGFEGSRRGQAAKEGVKQLTNRVNTLIVVENDKLYGLGMDNFSFDDIFLMTSKYLGQGIQAIVEPCLISGDFTSIRTVLKEMGLAAIGKGRGSGQNRAVLATKEALNSSQFEDCSLEAVKRAILVISSQTILSNSEIESAKWTLKKEKNPAAIVTCGATIDSKCDDNEIHVTLICDFVKKPPVPTSHRESEDAFMRLKRQKH